MSKKKRKFRETFIGKSLILVAKTPIYAWRGLRKFKKYSDDASKKRKRGLIGSVYSEFRVLSSETGNYQEWEEKVFNSDSKIGVILGARGTGKTAFGIKFLENFYSKKKKRCYAIGFDKDEMPLWINAVEDIKDLSNNSVVLIDEGGVLFSSRRAMSSANKLLNDLILVARHKNLSILFISQNSSNLDVNILRQADFLVLKPSSLLQKDFERKIIQKIYESVQDSFNKSKNKVGITYIYSDDFRGFVTNSLPSFWGESISKGFR